MRNAVVAALMLGLVATANAEGLNVGPVIDELGQVVPDVRKTLTKRNKASDFSILKFNYWTHRQAYQEDLDEALDEAFSSLMPDVYGPTRSAVKEFDQAIAHGKNEISELKVKQLTAPDAASGGTLIDRALRRSVPSGSKEGIQNKIAEIEKEISEVERSKAELIASFSQKLAIEYGVSIAPEQAKAALYQVNGKSIIEAVVAISVLLDVEKRLKEILALGIEPAVASYEKDWFPKLNAMEADNQVEMENIRKTIKNAKVEANAKAARANLAAREKIASTITKYRRVLTDRLKVTQKALEKAREDAEVAFQTLMTLETASQLGRLYEESTAEINALMQIKSPELLPLDDSTLEQFIQISDEMLGS